MLVWNMRGRMKVTGETAHPRQANGDVRRFVQRCLHCVYVRQAEHLSATTLENVVSAITFLWTVWPLSESPTLLGDVGAPVTPAVDAMHTA